ncbi:MAG: cobalamin-dependent protein [Dehalococcoidia bacterium]|nr:cobalamin-dependent protein [Dehalococcoidia bacterium]
MTDVLLLSSVFSEVKIAEPMGACILAAACRARRIEVEVIEPSVEGWDVRRSVEEVARRRPRVVGLSMLRDKHVDAVRKFVALLRARLPDAFIVVGGHGPSIAVSAILPEQVEAARPYLAEAMRVPPEGRSILDRAVPIPQPLAAPFVVSGPFVDSDLTGRGRGAGDLGREGATEPWEDDSAMSRAFLPLADDEDEYGMFGSVDADSPYFDKSKEYLQILSAVDAYLLGEADTTFPPLVRAVLDGTEWRDTPRAAYFDEAGRLVRNAMPPKVPDIDVLPHMSRDILREYQSRYGDVPASVLASRGCYYRCTFCSVVQYERLQEGSIHRQRSNDDLIAELTHLHDRYGVTRVNFEDDNFIVKNKRGIEKLHDLADRLQALPFRLSFTFFCRADAVEEDLFRHLRDAGLDGLYFGMESVHDTDLEFFHKGTKATDNFEALDTLMRLGFSPAVDAERRIMLGYITWHPLTSFAGLRATGAFIRQYQAPPKLLRRQLRLYSATEVVGQVEALGLLAPETSGGWVFADRRIEGLDRVVDAFAATANETRDRLRTLEKAHAQQGHEVPYLEDIRDARIAIDDRLVQHFLDVVDLAEGAPMGGRSLEVRAYDEEARAAFERFVADRGLPDLIEQGYRACGFPTVAKDLYRK